MHQSHQTRLTTLTNQLNKQYTENTDTLKSDHHEQKLQYENELEKTNKVNKYTQEFLHLYAKK